MRIHKAGISIILFVVLIELAVLVLLKYTIANVYVDITAAFIALFLLIFVLRFFRFPYRNIAFNENEVIAPADGKVVVIEKIENEEYTGQKMTQISIFMSVWNVHINWLPVLGKVVDSMHFNGNFKRAILPKASSENERSVVILQPTKLDKKIVVKQIAGAVARRIITYAKANDNINAGDQLGFIRFGSRVDILLPSEYIIDVKIGNKTKGGISQIAHLQ